MKKRKPNLEALLVKDVGETPQEFLNQKYQVLIQQKQASDALIKGHKEQAPSGKSVFKIPDPKDPLLAEADAGLDYTPSSAFESHPLLADTPYTDGSPDANDNQQLSVADAPEIADELLQKLESEVDLENRPDLSPDLKYQLQQKLQQKKRLEQRLQNTNTPKFKPY